MIVLLFLVMFVMVSSVLNFIVSVEKMSGGININKVEIKYVDFHLEIDLGVLYSRFKCRYNGDGS